MEYTYQTRGVCARAIHFDLTDGKVSNVSFDGGCNGNLKAVSKLVDGKPAEEIISILKGNTCGFKGTSCADQLTKGLEEAIAKGIK